MDYHDSEANALSEAQEKELDEIFVPISQLPSGTFDITDSTLRVKIAQFSLDVLRATANYIEDINDSCYNLTSWFGKYNLGTTLDHIFQKIGQLEVASKDSEDESVLELQSLQKSLNRFLDRTA